ncbi:MAG: ribosomal RNA small subunit methyltransferase A [Parcubacteria group bacterium]|nr:ribosomal RNA small subunit methyltransferase A [Parcubacteria group bacterium]
MSDNFFSAVSIKKILAQHHIYPKKSLGQNFLINPGVLEKIIQAADLKKEDEVLEIGAGLGTLTVALARKAKKVVAIEKDKQLAQIAAGIFESENLQNIRLIQADILKLDIQSLNLAKNYALVANLPYNIASRVIQKFLDSEFQPQKMIIMVQKEVGQRILARPPDMNLLALSVQIFANAQIADYVKKGSFWPQPKVDSAILKIIPKTKKPLKKETKKIFKIARPAFQGKRKTILNTLSKNLSMDKAKTEIWIKKAGLNPKLRPENLSLKDWIKLVVLRGLAS